MRKLAIVLIPLLVMALIIGAAGCDGEETPTSTPTPTPTATPPPYMPYMPSAKYRFTPPYSAKFDLESSKGFNIVATSAEYPSWEWSEYVCILPRNNSGIANLVLTSTFDEDFDISVRVKVRELLTALRVPEGIRVDPSSDFIHLESRESTSLDIKVEVNEDVGVGLYYVLVVATIEGYRSGAVLWLLVSGPTSYFPSINYNRTERRR